MDNVKIDSRKSLEIMNEIVNNIQNMNDTIKDLDYRLSSINSDGTWICENADFFKEKSLAVLNNFNVNCYDMYKYIVKLIESIEKYEKADKEVSKEFE